MSLRPGARVGHYIITTLIGKGGMASVYQATHAVLQSQHAIKVLDPRMAHVPELRLRFLEEGRIQAQLKHPNITVVTDIVSEEGVAGLVMPLLEGQDMEQRLREGGPLPPEQAQRWILQVLDALSFVHKKGITHRDLKPSNFFLERQPGGREVVKVMDFGIAKVVDQSLTRTGMGTMGTPAYMSPEQIRSPKNVDQRADLFSLGIVLYELLSGQNPYDGDSDFETQRRITQGDRTPLRALRPELPAALLNVVETALAVDRSQRFQTAEAFAEALQATVNAPEPAQMLAQRAPPARKLARDDTPSQEPGQRKSSLLVPLGALVLVGSGMVLTGAAALFLALGAGGRAPQAETTTVAFETSPPPPPAVPEPAPSPAPSPAPPGYPMVEIPLGSFLMGSDPSQGWPRDSKGLSERQRQVTVAGFYLGTVEVTQDLYAEVMGDNPAMTRNRYWSKPTSRSCRRSLDGHHSLVSDQYPAICVSWNDAVAFCNALSLREGLSLAYRETSSGWSWDENSDGYRLPTEEEWEYAARAGVHTLFSGTDASAQVCRFGNVLDRPSQEVVNSSAAPFPCTDNVTALAPVGQLEPNPWGLHDMTGNVWEWVWDSVNQKRMMRGGSWYNAWDRSRVSYRLAYGPDRRDDDLGFRVARTITE